MAVPPSLDTRIPDTRILDTRVPGTRILGIHPPGTCAPTGPGLTVRGLRLVLAGVGLLLALLLAGVWIIPGMLDWGRYRDSVATVLAAGIGRPVSISGAVTLSLLPEPVLTAAGISVADDGDGVVLTAQESRLRVALGPLLAGRVDARDLVLRGADLRLPWPPAPGALAQRPPTWLSGLQARVEDSRIQVGGVAFTGIDAGLATDPDTGTLSSTGMGTLGARVWRFTARLGRPGRDGSAGLDISLDGQGKLQDTGGTFAGVLAGDGSLSGRVAGRGLDLSGLMPAPPVAWRAEGRLSAAGGLAVADELALTVGGFPARGAVALRVLPSARLDLALAAGRLDLDAWLPVLARGTAPALPTGIDLSAEAAALAGGTLRRMRGGFDLDDDGVTLRDGQALLPGDATLTLSGRLPRGGRAATGTARLQAPDLRATLDWLAPLMPPALAAALAPPKLPSNVLRAADLAGKVSVGAGQASVSDLAGTLDGNALTGNAAVRLGPRPEVAAGLSLDRLLLDPWLPDPAALATLDGLASALARAAGLDAAALDADVQVQVGQATLRGIPLGRLALDVKAEANRLTLRRLEAAPLGGRLTASGTVGEGGRVADGALDASVPDLAPLRALLPPGFLLAPLLRGPGTLSATLSGPPDALAVRLAVEGGGVRLEAQPVLALAARRWAGPVSLHHPGAPRLLETLRLPGTAAWLGDGSLSLLAQVAAGPGQQAAVSRFDLVAGSLRASGQMTLDGRRVSGQVAAETLPLPLPYPRSRDPLPFWALQGWEAALRLDADQVLLGGSPAIQGLSADLSLQAGVLRVPRAAAKLLPADPAGGDPAPGIPTPGTPAPGTPTPGTPALGDLTGTAMLDAAADPPQLAVSGQLANLALLGPALATPLDLVAGMAGARLDLQATGHSPAALLATAAGTVAATVEAGTLSGLDLPAMSAALAGTEAGMAGAARAALLGGTTPFRKLDLSGDVRRGVASVTGLLTADAGEVAVGGSLDLLGLADLRLLVRPRPPGVQPDPPNDPSPGQPPGPPSSQAGPELGLLLTGPLGSQRTPELAGLLRWLAGRS